MGPVYYPQRGGGAVTRRKKEGVKVKTGDGERWLGECSWIEPVTRVYFAILRAAIVDFFDLVAIYYLTSLYALDSVDNTRKSVIASPFCLLLQRPQKTNYNAVGESCRSVRTYVSCATAPTTTTSDPADRHRRPLRNSVPFSLCFVLVLI
jgi:hypothetical protein